MMHHNKFVVAIRANGKVLREDNGTVAIPFGSEYEIRLKNINSVKAQVRVSIDGEEATDWLVLRPNSTLDLEGFLRKNSYKVGNRFKFIERTANIEKHKGIGAEDGLVHVEYKFEKVYQQDRTVIHHEPHYHRPWWEYTYYPYNGAAVWTVNTTPCIGQSNLSGQVTYTSNLGDSEISDFQVSRAPMNSCFAMNCSMDPAPVQPTSTIRSTAVANNIGITVPGSDSNQTFQSTYDFACEQSEVIVLRLVGNLNEKPVARPITVDLKPTCITCGRVNKANSKFCTECGTALVIK